MNLTPHFTLEELTYSETAERLNIDNTPSPEQLQALRENLAPGMEAARAILGGFRIFVSSGLRTRALNAVIPGSSSTSAHTKGYAADWTCPGFGTPWEICNKLAMSTLVYDQIIYESALNRYGKLVVWVHSSFDPRARSILTTKLPGQDYRNGLHQE